VSGFVRGLDEWKKEKGHEEKGHASQGLFFPAKPQALLAGEDSIAP
jgi:hypothetical protein